MGPLKNQVLRQFVLVPFLFSILSTMVRRKKQLVKTWQQVFNEASHAEKIAALRAHKAKYEAAAYGDYSLLTLNEREIYLEKKESERAWYENAKRVRELISQPFYLDLQGVKKRIELIQFLCNRKSEAPDFNDLLQHINFSINALRTAKANINLLLTKKQVS